MDAKYQRGKIYTIRSNKTDLVYVGSTSQKYLSDRMSTHRYDFEGYKKGGRKYLTVFDIFEVDKDCYIELYEYYPCNSKLELDKREGEVIRELVCVNKVVAGRTQKEYYQENKEYILTRQKQYAENNKEYIKARKKKYREDNKEKINAESREYYHNNKEKINAQQNQKHNCDCGGKYTQSNKARHMKSKKHQAFINQ